MEPAPKNEEAEEVPPEVLWDRVAWSTDLLAYEDFEAVRPARDRCEPLMLKSLRDVASEPARYAQEARHHGHQCALAFLAEFGAVTAFPAIVQFLADIRGFEDALLPGDMIMDDLPPILASTYDGNLDLLKTLIEDESADELVRTATVAAMGILVQYEKVRRDDLSTCLGSLIQTLPREPSAIWDELTALVLKFQLAEHREAVEQLIASDVVDFLAPDALASAFGPGVPPTIDMKKHFVDDAEELIDQWREFNWGSDLPEDVLDELDEVESEDEAATWDENGEPESDDHRPEVPFVRETPKVGRNEPCPCGSGKKYKRCCEGK